jgi:hypothetical protein
MSLRPRSALYEYQSGLAVPKLIELPQVGGFMGVGTGKTISALTSLVDRGMPKTLVVAPMRVARRVWTEEAAAWEHTAAVRVNVLAGTPEQRAIRLHHRADVDTISYELFPWLTEQVDVNKRYGAVVWDEGQKMKTPGSTRFKRMRYRAMEIPVRILLTGHPVGNHYADLWGEMFAATGEKALGPSKVLYMMQYFTAYEIDEYVKGWSINYGAADLIHARIKPFAFSLDPKLTNKWEKRFNPISVDLPKYVRELSEELAQELRTYLAISGTELLALSSSARSMKVRQMAGGAVYTAPDEWEEVHTEKLDALEDLVDEMQGEPLLVAYWYRHELERLLRRFPQGRVLKTKQDEDDWNARKIEVGFIHPASMGEGVNLQFGGHNIAWYTLPWSFNFFSQTNGRLPRPGQKSDHIMHHILLAGDADVAVLQYLREQELADQATREAVQL